ECDDGHSSYHGCVAFTRAACNRMTQSNPSNRLQGRTAVFGSLFLLSLVLILPLSGMSQRPSGAARNARPNIVFILIDDLRWDELGVMGHPYLKTPNIDRIGKEGAVLRNAFMTTPLCSPSRASFLTGQYAHTHGIIDNIDRSAASHQLVTFPLLLRQSGYETAFVGKWHMGNDDARRPGFDRWVSFKGQGTYLNPELNEDGTSVKASGYITDILSGYAVEFIKRRHDKPFLMYLAHKAVHPEVMQRGDGSVNLADAELFIPAERHRNLYAGRTIPHRPNYKRAPEGKPALQRRIGDLPPLGAATATRDDAILGRQRSLMAIEEGVGKILEALKDTRKLDNTIIVFASDNGYFYGEHGLSVERRLAYEESIRMPLLVRYPKAIKAGTIRDEFALNIDLAPTLLELAGVDVPATMQGRSLVPLLQGERPAWRNSFLIEYYSDKVFPRVLQMGYKAVRNERWKYIHYLELEGMDELYDLKIDPYEMKNLIHEPSAAMALAEMKQEMERLLKETSANPASTGPV
ncbi:MAG: sulfatase, partial [Pyrinomonadaceae bacterium]|nr:sulfatase [Pyrinomonadaceae bacterium]